MCVLDDCVCVCECSAECVCVCVVYCCVLWYLFFFITGVNSNWVTLVWPDSTMLMTRGEHLFPSCWLHLNSPSQTNNGGSRYTSGFHLDFVSRDGRGDQKRIMLKLEGVYEGLW